MNATVSGGDGIMELFVDWVQLKAPRLFLTIVSCNLGPERFVKTPLQGFKRFQISDERLSLSEENAEEILKGSIKGASPSARADCYAKQWMYIGPVFKPNEFLYKIHPRTTLPITERDDLMA